MPTDIVNSTMREAGYCAGKLSEGLSWELRVDLSCQVMDEISFFFSWYALVLPRKYRTILILSYVTKY